MRFGVHGEIQRSLSVPFSSTHFLRHHSQTTAPSSSTATTGSLETARSFKHTWRTSGGVGVEVGGNRDWKFEIGEPEFASAMAHPTVHSIRACKSRGNRNSNSPSYVSKVVR